MISAIEKFDLGMSVFPSCSDSVPRKPIAPKTPNFVLTYINPSTTELLKSQYELNMKYSPENEYINISNKAIYIKYWGSIGTIGQVCSLEYVFRFRALNF